MESARSRPYRSHKYPACDICRKRKARCLIEGPGSSCRLCRERGYQCSSVHNDTRSSSSAKYLLQADVSKQSRLKHASIKGARLRSNSPHSQNESSLLVNPSMAEDITIVQDSIPSDNVSATITGEPSKYKTLSQAKQTPIVYLRVPRWRAGRPPDPAKGKSQLEIIEQVLRGKISSILDLFYTKIYPCFPVTSEPSDERSEGYNPALLCTIYAISTLYWSNLSTIASDSLPDMTFLWNQAVIALNESYRAPSLTTIQASLISMIGRPILGIQDNILDAGRTVALAQGLGLHRNPQQWKISQSEKALRIQIWWGVLVNDTWSSLAHGTPPLIQIHCCDVPLPKEISDNHLAKHESNHSFFHHLCKLTSILAGILPLIYEVYVTDTKGFNERIKHIEYEIHDWEKQLPISLNHVKSGAGTCENGSSGLWFLYLVVKLLVCRLQMKGLGPLSDTNIPDLQRCQSAFCDASNAAISYVLSLTKPQLNEFWLPYTAHLLVLATTMLLRCATESNEMLLKRKLVDCLDRLRRHLLWAKIEHNWELGDFTLDRCGEIIQQFVSDLPSDNEEVKTPQQHSLTLAGDEEMLTTDWQFADIGADLFSFVWDNDFVFLDQR